MNNDIEYKHDVIIGNRDIQQIIDIPTIRVHTLDTCYAHAVLDRVFVWFWIIHELKKEYPHFTYFNLLVGKDLIEQFPQNLVNIDEESKTYKNIWKSLSQLIPDTHILFEHLLPTTQFTHFFVPPYHDKWQRTPWNCELYYPERHVSFHEIRFSDEEIYTKLQSFRDLVLQKYNIIPTKTNNLIIIDRKHDRKFEKSMLEELTTEVSKDTNWKFCGIKYLENMTFEEQVMLFASTKIIICIHGAGMINLLWSQYQSIIFEIDVQTNRRNMYKRISKLTDSMHFYLFNKNLSIKSDIIEKLSILH
jgi:hypothetical protein